MTNEVSSNILLITSDQQPWLALGYYNSEIQTPNLDRLARRGVVLDRAYCPNPTCTPTRASLLTGQYPSQHGAYALGTGLDPNTPTLNDILHQHGYVTGLVGKAHFQPLKSTEEHDSLEAYPTLQDLDFWRYFEGPFYGFDHFELARNHCDEGHVGQHYALWLEERYPEWRNCFQAPGGRHEAQYGAWNLPQEYHYNNWIVDRTNAFLDARASDGLPFFLWCSHFDPHPPYLVPEPWASMYDPDALTLPDAREGEHAANPRFHRFAFDPEGIPEAYGIYGRWMHGVTYHGKSERQLRQNLAIYYGMISFMDDAIGKTLDRLEDLGLVENTLVVFTSDHGHYTGQHGLTAKGPFHYEEGIRVPLIVSQPGSVPEGRKFAAMQSLVDLPPTFLSAAGAKIPARMTGLDQLAVWRGRKDARRCHCVVENAMEPGSVELKTYVDDRYKLTVYRAFDEGELFDFENDPGEFENRFDDPNYAEVKTRLLQRFLQAEMAKEPRPMPRVSVA